MTTRDRILLSLLLYKGKTSYQKVYSFLPPEYDRPNFYGILRRMEHDQLIKRSAGEHQEQLIRLGPDALIFLESRFGPRVRSLLSLSGNNATMQQCNNFSLVIYDFPLSMAYNRARLQTKLEQLGMGMLRKGVYISPYDVLGLVSAWAEENDLLEKVTLMKVMVGGSNSHLEKIWDLSTLAKQYVTLLDRLAIVRGQQIKEKRVSGLRRIKSNFLELVSRDPLLPKSLTTSDWPFARVEETLINID